MGFNPQKPAQGIMLDNEYDNSKFYTVSCTCGGSDDQIKMEICTEDDLVEVHVWTTVKTDWWRQTWPIMTEDYGTFTYYFKSFVNAVCGRARVIWRVLTKGYVEMESWTILSDQQAVNLAWILHEDVKKFQETRGLTKRKK